MTLTKERFCGSDYRFIAVCLVLLAGATWYSVRNFYRAFPEASIDFRLSRADAQAGAGRFLAELGYNVASYRQATRFSFDNNAKTFLEREAGMEQANQIMGSRIKLWRWSYRWFRPQQKEEYRVDFTTRGDLAGFEHLLPEEAARPAATAEQARAIAEDFLRRRLQLDLGSLEFVEVSEVGRPNRSDRVFTWKERDFNLHDATNRLGITVLGNEVGGYREYLKIPEQWTRDYQRLRSKNEVAGVIDAAVTAILFLGLIVVLVLRVRRQDVRWRLAAVVGVVGATLSLLASLNEFPLHEFGYPTTDSYGSFVATRLFWSVLGALGSGLFLFVLTAGAEPLYREAYPDKISLSGLLRLRGVRTKRFFLGSILGISLCGIFIAYQTAFYIVANRFGAWAPVDVPYSNLLNTRFPWLFVLLGGFMPAVFEEFLFRMFAIPFLRRLVRSLALAVVLAGFIWGFGHAGYPNQPFYIRGVEVGIAGVVLGLIMLRWGILPALVWHYSIDAMYGAMLLVRSESLYFRLSGAASAGILVLPILVALVAYWRRGGFEPESGLLNGAEAGPAQEPTVIVVPEPATLEYRPLTARLRVTALVFFALGLLTLLIPTSRFGKSPDYRIPAGQAAAAAEAFLRTQGFDPSAFRHVTFPATHWSGDDSLAGKYFLERRPVNFVSNLFERYRPVQHWLTRYFKSLDQEEASVSVHPETGTVLSFGHTIPEDRPGADIPQDAARQIASAFAAAQGWDLTAMELKESTSEKKKARRDHTLVWEARNGDPRNVDEAHYRVSIAVAGDRVSSLRGYWKIPEAYSRSRSQQNSLSIAVTVARFTVPFGAVLCALWLLIQNTRKGLVRWRAAVRLAIPATLLSAVSLLLSTQLLFKGYKTAISLEIFEATMAAGLLMIVIFWFLMLGGASAFLMSFYPNSTSALRTVNRRVLGKDAAIVTLLAIGLAVFLDQVAALLTARFHAYALFSIISPDLIVSTFPAITALAGGVPSVLLNAATIALAAVIVQKLRKRWMLVPFALLAIFFFDIGDVRTPGEFALQYGLSLITMGCIVAFCVWFARNNYLAYALVLWLLALRPSLTQLFGNHNPGHQVQALLVTTVLVASAAWAILPSLRRGSDTARAAAQVPSV